MTSSYNKINSSKTHSVPTLTPLIWQRNQLKPKRFASVPLFIALERLYEYPGRLKMSKIHSLFIMLHCRFIIVPKETKLIFRDTFFFPPSETGIMDNSF